MHLMRMLAPVFSSSVVLVVGGVRRVFEGRPPSCLDEERTETLTPIPRNARTHDTEDTEDDVTPQTTSK